jgi:phosphate-selective porin OprO/OprP
MEQGAFGEVTEANYHLGIVARTWGPQYTLTAAVQGNTINSTDVNLASQTTTASAEERMQYLVRGTFIPINDDRRKLHLGLWARYRDSASDGAFTYETRANTALAPRFSSTGAIGDSDTLIGAELMGIFGPFSLQAEYANINVEVRPNLVPATAQDGNIQVGYVYASWWPTGEIRNYDITRGEFGRPRILSPITSGGWGGVELAARYDFADLSDIQGTNVALTPFAGEFRAFTFGANYYPTGYVRVMANYTHAEHDNATAANSSSEDIFQMRGQLDF